MIHSNQTHLLKKYIIKIKMFDKDMTIRRTLKHRLMKISPLHLAPAINLPKTNLLRLERNVIEYIPFSLVEYDKIITIIKMILISVLKRLAVKRCISKITVKPITQYIQSLTFILRSIGLH